MCEEGCGVRQGEAEGDCKLRRSVVKARCPGCEAVRKCGSRACVVAVLRVFLSQRCGLALIPLSTK